MNDGSRTVALHVKGRVQGVNYRNFACEAARRLALVGWVVNQDDGSVAAAVHGPGPALASFIEACRTGPSAAQVDGLDVRSVDRGFADEPPPGAYRF